MTFSVAIIKNKLTLPNIVTIELLSSRYAHLFASIASTSTRWLALNVQRSHYGGGAVIAALKCVREGFVCLAI